MSNYTNILSFLNDIPLTSFTAADNQVSAADVTGFTLSNSTVRAFEAQLTVTRGSTYSLYKIEGIQRASDWFISQSETGDITGLGFSMTSAGQLQYTSTSTGSTATVKFRIYTISI